MFLRVKYVLLGYDRRLLLLWRSLTLVHFTRESSKTLTRCHQNLSTSTSVSPFPIFHMVPHHLMFYSSHLCDVWQIACRNPALYRCVNPWKIREKASIQLCWLFVERVNNLLRPTESQIVHFADNAWCLVPSQYEFQLRRCWIQFSPPFPGWTENSAWEDEPSIRCSDEMGQCGAEDTAQFSLLPLRPLQAMPKSSSNKETPQKFPFNWQPSAGSCRMVKISVLWKLEASYCFHMLPMSILDIRETIGRWTWMW